MLQNNLILNTDAYTISSNKFVSKRAKKRSVYNFTNRYSPTKNMGDICSDSRMVFYGVSEFIRRYLKPITRYDVMNAAHFMESANSFGGPLSFDADLWYRVVDECDGNLPIKIEAIKEGSTFFPNEPIVKVTSLGEGFGEIAAHIEPLLVGVVSHATARLTLERHWLQYLRDRIAITYDWSNQEKIDQVAQNMIHDFGYRANFGQEAAEIGGLAHLLCFNGTDTFCAAKLARDMGALPPIGCSIEALAHRTILGHESEGGAFESLNNTIQSTCRVGSFVSDCYNFTEAIDRLIRMAKDDPCTTYVARPDSGNHVKTVLHICKKAKEAGLYENGEFGIKPKNLMFIYGDSVNPEKMKDILDSLQKDGFDPFAWGVFGIGGYLVNTPNRDILSSAYKLSACGDDEPVVKLSEVKSKLSVPGPNSIKRTYSERPTVGIGNTGYETYYNAGNSNLEDFPSIRKRVIEDFDRWEETSSKFPMLGLSPTLLDDDVLAIQENVFQEHRCNLKTSML